MNGCKFLKGHWNIIPFTSSYAVIISDKLPGLQIAIQFFRCNYHVSSKVSSCINDQSYKTEIIIESLPFVTLTIIV